MSALSIEVSRHLTRRGACRAATLHAHRLRQLGHESPWSRHHVQVRRIRGVRRWVVIER